VTIGDAVTDRTAMRAAMVARLESGLPIYIAIDEATPFCTIEPRGSKAVAIVGGRESPRMPIKVAVDKAFAAYDDAMAQIRRRRDSAHRRPDGLRRGEGGLPTMGAN